MDVLGHDLHQPREHVGARARVARLLLDPQHLAQVRVASHQRQELAFRERVEELDAGDREAGVRGAFGMADEVVVDLARAEHEPRDLPVLDARLGEHRVEPCALRHLRDRAGRLRQPQQRLGRHHDQRPLLGDARLAAQQVEVLGRGGRAGDADVPLGRQREEALEPRRGVLWAGALVAVGQQQRQP